MKTLTDYQSEQIAALLGEFAETLELEALDTDEKLAAIAELTDALITQEPEAAIVLTEEE